MKATPSLAFDNKAGAENDEALPSGHKSNHGAGMRADTKAAGLAFLFGGGSTVASMALPQAYPDLPVYVWRILSWGGMAAMAISAAVLVSEWLLRHAIRGKGKALPLTLMIISGFVFLGSGIWFLVDRSPGKSPPAIATSPETEAPPTDLETSLPRVFLLLYPFDYRVGADISGIKWERGYSHIEITIRNESDITYENFNANIALDRIIQMVRILSPLNACRIAPTGHAPPSLVVGNGIVMPAEGNGDDFSNENRLICDRFAARTEITLVMATVAGQNWVMGQRDRDDPTHAIIKFDYTAGGKHEHAGLETGFHKIEIPPDISPPDATR